MTRKEDIKKKWEGIDNDTAAFDLLNEMNTNQKIVEINQQKGRIEVSGEIRNQFPWDKKTGEHVLYIFKGDES